MQFSFIYLCHVSTLAKRKENQDHEKERTSHELNKQTLIFAQVCQSWAVCAGDGCPQWPLLTMKGVWIYIQQSNPSMTVEISQIYHSPKMASSFGRISLVEFLWLLPGPDKNCTSSPTMKTNPKFCNFLCITKHTIVKFSCLCYFLMDLWSLVIQKFM